MLKKKFAESERRAAKRDPKAATRAPKPSPGRKRLPAQAGRYAFASGRQVTMGTTGQEEITVRSPQGDIEVQILLTNEGPLLRLGGVRLELETIESIALRCKRFEVMAGDMVSLRSGGQIEAKAESDMRLNGERLFFNCDADFGN